MKQELVNSSPSTKGSGRPAPQATAVDWIRPPGAVLRGGGIHPSLPPASTSPPALGIAHECQSFRRNHKDEGLPLSQRAGSTSTHRAAIVLNATAPTPRRPSSHSPATVGSVPLERKYDKCVRLRPSRKRRDILFLPGANRWEGVNPGRVTGFMCVCVGLSSVNNAPSVVVCVFFFALQVHQKGEMRTLVRAPSLRIRHQAVCASQRPPKQHLRVPVQRHGEWEPDGSHLFSQAGSFSLTQLSINTSCHCLPRN